MGEPSIGGQTFLWMRNALPYAGEVLEDLIRTGVGGVAFRVVGWRAEPVTIYTRTLCYTYFAADQAMFAYASMQGLVWTVVDEFGLVRPGVIVKQYRPMRTFKTYVGSTVPTGVYAVLDSEWTLQDTVIY